MIEKALQRALEEALRAAHLPWEGTIPIERPKDPSHGDWSSPVAFLLARALGRPPRPLADELVRALRTDREEVAEVTVAGAGFINFRLGPAYFARGLQEILSAGPQYGRASWGNGERVMVEFVSSNPTGPLTVGHGRQAALGDVIANLLEATGHTVTREYYFNDAGRQMEILGRSLYARYAQHFDPQFPFPEEGYKGDYLLPIAQRAREAFGDGHWRGADPGRETLEEMREFAVREIVTLIDRDLSDFRIRFDVWSTETSLHRDGTVAEVLALLDKAGASYEQDGALWFRGTAFGDSKDRVMVRRTGEPTYFLTDVAYHLAKRRRGFARSINLHGADHHGYAPRMLAAMRALGHPEGFLVYLIHQMVTFMEGGQEMRMSTRAGTFVTLRDLMDKVGVDAARYFFVMRRADSHLVFDLDLARSQTEENPVYYVQYAHARLAHIEAFARASGRETSPQALLERADPTLLREPEERELIGLLLDYPAVVEGVARALEPHRLTGYCEDLARAFHLWYQRHRVVTADERLTDARLLLAAGMGSVLLGALSLLGVTAPERM